jgi:thiamine transporter
MLPIIFFAVRWGLGWGFGASLVYGFLQYFAANGIAISWISMIADYIIAYSMLGLAGLFRGRKYGIFWGCAVASVARFVVHFIAGVTVWAEYMPESFTNLWVYSAVYNGSYMLPDAIIIILISAFLYKPLNKYILGADIA